MQLLKEHPNIMRLHHFYEDDKRYMVISELCTGGELFEVIKRVKVLEAYDAAIILK